MSRLGSPGTCLAGVILLCLLPQCREDSPGASNEAARHGILKLVDVAAGVIDSPSSAPPLEPILSSVLSESRGWHSLLSLERPDLPASDAELTARFDVDEEDHARLNGVGGAIYRLIEVEPGQSYAISGRSRTTGLEVGDEHSGGNFYVAELNRFAEPAELFASGKGTPFRGAHAFEARSGTSDWQDEAVVLETTRDTRCLLIACVLSFPGPVESGTAEFADLEVRRIPEREVWRARRRQSVVAWRPGSARRGDWRDECVTRARVGAESRPSIVMLPGESVTLTIEVPSDRPRLEVGLGPWSECLVEGRAARFDLAIDLDGKRLVQESLSGSGPPLAWRWNSHSLDLSAFAGRRATLRFRAEGDLPTAIGAPIVRPGSIPPARPNVVLISIDTLRADHVGALGYPLPTTPRLDALARDGWLFTDMTSASAYTLPSHATMLSGQQPSVHGVQRSDSVLSAARTTLLAEIFSRAGYRTRAFAAGGYVSPHYGFDRGFDAFSAIDPIRAPDSEKYRAYIHKHPDLVTPDLFREHAPPRIREWLGEHRDEPFFLFIHTYTVHDYDSPSEFLAMFDDGCESELTDHRPFVGPAGSAKLGEADLAHIVHLYDAALRYVDSEIGRLLDELEALGLADRTIVAVTSDHGEEFLEHGIFGHGHTLYQEMVHVPFILKIPGESPRVVDRSVMLADIAPTLLAAADLEVDAEKMQGIDVTGEALRQARPIWSEVDEFAHKLALKTQGGWKLIHGPEGGGMRFENPKRWELYELGVDAGEEQDRSEEEAARRKQLSEQLLKLQERWISIGESLGAAAESELDDETFAQLQQLGYFGKKKPTRKKRKGK